MGGNVLGRASMTIQLIGIQLHISTPPLILSAYNHARMGPVHGAYTQIGLIKISWDVLAIKSATHRISWLNS